MLAPTEADRGLHASIAFQRTDLAMALLSISWLAIAMAAAGISRIAIAVAALGLVVAAGGIFLIRGNPYLGDLAAVLLFAPAGLAMAFALLRRYRAAAAAAAARLAEQRGGEAAPEPSVAGPASDEPTPEGAPEALEEESEPRPSAADRLPAQVLPPLRHNPLANYDDEDTVERVRFLRMRASDAGSTEKGLQLWQKLIEEFPDYYPALNAAARVLFRLGRHAEALGHLERSLEIASDDPATLRLAARIATARDDWDAAADYWARAFAADEMSADAASAYLQVLLKGGRAKEARTLHHRFADRWPEDARLAEAGAAAAEADDADAEAAALWNAAADLDPAAYSNRLKAIRAQLRLERYDEAVAALQAFMVDAPNEAGALALAREILDAIDESDDKDVADVLDVLGPADGAWWAVHVRKQLDVGDHEAAETLFQQGLDRGMDDAALLRVGAEIASASGSTDELLERWRAAAEADPEDADANREAALLLAASGDVEGALPFAEKGMAKHVDDVPLARILAAAASAAEDWDAALDAWTAIGRFDSVDGEAARGAARALRGLERTAEAELFVSAAIREFPQHAELWTEAARIAEARGVDAAAATRWRAVTELTADDAEAWIGLIGALTRLGDIEAARATLAKARGAVADADRLAASPEARAVESAAGQRAAVASE